MPEYMKNCNNFIGCLWDVTDKDLDRFSVAMIKDMLYNSETNLATLVQKHRKKVKLEYLNGGSIVLWGISN